MPNSVLQTKDCVETEQESASPQKFVVTGNSSQARRLLWHIMFGSVQYERMSQTAFEYKLIHGHATADIHEQVDLVFAGSMEDVLDDEAHHVIRVYTSSVTKCIDFALSGSTLIITLPSRAPDEALVGCALSCIEHIEGQLSSFVPDYHPRQSTLAPHT